MANNMQVNKLFMRKFAKQLTDQKRFPLFTKVSTYYGPELVRSGYKVGDSFSVVVPTNATAEKGLKLNHIDDYVEESKLVTVQNVHQAFQFTIDEMMFFLDPATPDQLGMGQEQRLQAMFSVIQQDFIDLSRSASNYIPLSADDTVNGRWVIAKNKLIAQGCPVNSTDYFAFISSTTDTLLVKENRNVYNHSAEITNQLKTGEIKQMNGWNYVVDQNVGVFSRSALAADTLTVNGADQDGNKIAVSGITAGNKGINENVTIDGVYEVDINTKRPTNKLKQFNITTNNDSTLTFSVDLKTSGQFQNVSNAPANGAKINFLGAGEDKETEDFGFYKQAFLFIPIDASQYSKLQGAESQIYRDPMTGLTILLTSQGDIRTMSNIFRADIFYAVAHLKEEWTVKVPSKPGAY